MALDLGAKGTCMIGGNLATNAGGINFIRLNSLHANTIGLKAVLADGTILDNMTTLRKDNTGYDMKHLFIGAEGTLGVITEAAMLCPPLLKNKNLALLACRSFEHVIDLLKSAKSKLGESIYSFEVMDRESVGVVLDNISVAKFPFDRLHPFYVLVETATNNVEKEGMQGDMDKLFNYLADHDEQIVDGVIPQD
eukprot:CAMPEP_0176379060 /NCGR_PEP_ID=MMETSP0126-20121128/30087_1 /TAXON_ID=141414 ORGANISM="Strombidinopsis acuminatum, Strain SPMC142" /NCGR_SAMPLE_ID=MMETSP0126 /ASSEMBLY_ACC=CAM_ASM_000229 /LENGTH=193 /DNA_ID=CAMNT_0017741673 /DNA_START=514 /DNA_END=1095 /DNA_ORIENTATION=-